MSASSFELNRRDLLGGLGLVGMTALAPRFASAQGRTETLLVVQELGPNSLDMQGVGSNQTVNGLSWNCYDRLLTYASKTLPDGTLSYDREKLAPELAESWEVAADGMSCTFKLRKDAKFHDGTPVTAKDVKWSFDRAVKVGGFPTFQMSAGSLEKPEQFVVVDDHTFRIDYVRKDKMLLFNVAVVVPFIINSELAKKNATPEDPWALAWLRNNEAGGGAYRIESWKPGSETILARFDDWKSGPLPKIRRIIARDVPSAGTRRAMLERGDADISSGFAPRDFEQIIKEGKVKVIGRADPECALVRRAQHGKAAVRQCEAAPGASPGRCPMSRSRAARSSAAPFRCMAEPAEVSKPVWPQPFPYVTDLDKAKALMKEAGFESGLETTLSLDTGTATVGEPTAVLIQESLAKIGIKAAIEKIPGANWRTTLNKKELPLALNRFSGWLDYPEYYFYWNFHGNNSIFNISSYQNKEMDALIDKARFTTDAGGIRNGREGFHRALHARRSGRSAQPADPRRRHAEGHQRLRVLVSPRAGLPAVREGLMPLDNADDVRGGPRLLGRKAQRQPCRAGAQHRGVELALPRPIQRTGEDPVELRAVIGNQQQIDAGVDRLDHGFEDVVLVDRTHHEVVGHHHALVTPLVADDAINNAFRMRGGAIGIDGRERHVPDHERAARMRQHLAEREPVGGLQLFYRRIEIGAEMMACRCGHGRCRENA